MKERTQPAGRQAARIFRPPSLATPTAHQAAVLEALAGIRGALGDMSGLLDRLAPAVLAMQTVQLDSSGTATAQFRVPFRAIAVDYFGTATLTVAADSLKQGAPGPGVGVAKVGPGGFAVLNMRSTVVSFYGNPGEFVTFTCYALPQPPAGVVNGTSGVQLAQPAASVSVYGKAAAPGAGGVVAATGALPAGLYQVAFYLGEVGTTAIADADNMQWLIGAAVQSALRVNHNADSPADSAAIIIPAVRIPAGGAAITVQAIAAASAGSTYAVQIVATQTGP